MKKILSILFLLFVLVSCNNSNTDESNKGNENNNNNDKQEVYVPTDTLVTFSDENADKVITESEYDISQYTKDAGTDIKPYQMFQSGMCLQRDAINRIWGKASKTSFIAAEINGQVYYGTIKSREWEIYLPKMKPTTFLINNTSTAKYGGRQAFIYIDFSGTIHLFLSSMAE